MSEHPLIVSRAARIVGVALSEERLGPSQLPTITVEVCVSPVGDLPHEHVVAPLTSDVVDAIEKGRSELPDHVVGETA